MYLMGFDVNIKLFVVWYKGNMFVQSTRFTYSWWGTLVGLWHSHYSTNIDVVKISMAKIMWISFHSTSNSRWSHLSHYSRWWIIHRNLSKWTNNCERYQLVGSYAVEDTFVTRAGCTNKFSFHMKSQMRSFFLHWNHLVTNCINFWYL